jgi:hypothetical protein
MGLFPANVNDVPWRAAGPTLALAPHSAFFSQSWTNLSDRWLPSFFRGDNRYATFVTKLCGPLFGNGQEQYFFSRFALHPKVFRTEAKYHEIRDALLEERFSSQQRRIAVGTLHTSTPNDSDQPRPTGVGAASFEILGHVEQR